MTAALARLTEGPGEIRGLVRFLVRENDKPRGSGAYAVSSPPPAAGDIVARIQWTSFQYSFFRAKATTKKTARNSSTQMPRR